MSDETQNIFNLMTKKAVGRIRKLSKGNGVPKDAVRIIKEAKELITCEAITHIELTHEIKEEKKKGLHEIGELVEDAAQLPKAIQKIVEEAMKNNDMRKALSNVLLERPDKGFAIHAEYFDVAPLNKEYSQHIPCQTCNAQGAINCQTCNGQRQESCNQCHGRTAINCNFCHGSGFMKGPNGDQIQCNRCFGKRQIKCPLCRSSGRIPCRTCKGVGQQKCGTCHGAKIYTLITRLFFKMKTLFEIDRAALPHPAVKVIENNGGKLVINKDIKLHGEPVKRKDGGLAIQYSIEFPYADLDIGINGKPFKVHMFGYKAKMLKISNFLDQIIEKNYALLKRAAENEGNVVAHIRKASKTRLIGQGLLLSVTMRPKRAMMELKKKFPIGASNDMLKDVILQSNKALINISRKSHLSGLGIGIIIATIINIAYFIGPLRVMIQNYLPEGHAVMLVDLSLIVIGGLVAQFISKFMAASPLKKALGPLMPAKSRSTFKPRNQNSQWPAYLASAVIFGIVVFATKFLPAITPAWFPF